MSRDRPITRDWTCCRDGLFILLGNRSSPDICFPPNCFHSAFGTDRPRKIAEVMEDPSRTELIAELEASRARVESLLAENAELKLQLFAIVKWQPDGLLRTLGGIRWVPCGPLSQSLTVKRQRRTRVSQREIPLDCSILTTRSGSKPWNLYQLVFPLVYSRLSLNDLINPFENDKLRLPLKLELVESLDLSTATPLTESVFLGALIQSSTNVAQLTLHCSSTHKDLEVFAGRQLVWIGTFEELEWLR